MALTPEQIKINERLERERQAKIKARKVAFIEKNKITGSFAAQTPTTIAPIESKQFATQADLEAERVAKKAIDEPIAQATQTIAEEKAAAEETARVSREEIAITEEQRKTSAGLVQEIEQLQRAQTEQRSKGQAAVLQAGEAGEVTGVQTGTSKLTSFQNVAQQNRDIKLKQAQSIQIQRDQAQRRFEKAAAEGKTAIAKKLQGDISALDAQLRDIEAEPISEDNTAFLEKLLGQEGGFATLTDQALQDFAATSSLTIPVLESLRALDKEKIEAQEIKDLTERANKLSIIAARKASILSEGQTTATRNLEFLQQLEDSGADQATIDNFKALTGIGAKPKKDKFQAIKVGDDLFSFNEDTGKVEKVVDNSKSDSLLPTGVTTTRSFAGRPVTLDEAAMVAFAQASADLEAAGLGQLKIGSIADSSTRNQADTINRMVESFNAGSPDFMIGFDIDNPNQAAESLRKRGIAVANVGASKHEKGLAVDIFPNQDYIAQVKGSLEANGWKQTDPVNDAGHFEFQGIVPVQLNDNQRQRFNKAIAGLSTQRRESNKQAIDSALKSGNEKEIESTLLEIERDKFLDRSRPIVVSFEKGVKDFFLVKDAFNRMEAVFNRFESGDAEGNLAIDQAIVIGFNKILDPGSVVRESEFARTPEGQSFISKMVGFAAQLKEGGVGLTDANRKEIFETTRALLEGATKTFEREKNRALRKAKVRGIPKEFIFAEIGLESDGSLFKDVETISLDDIVTDAGFSSDNRTKQFPNINF